jgi:NAD(P)-dependent dehydrogenase (short-subunit alcohol dehydrogenase family)/acyl dehydratase
MSAKERLNFDGRVAIVTGAGGGLGRTYALLLAARGCKVVVNDLGDSADKTVAEIVAAGGQAVADKHSVEDGEALAATALGAFGRIDILIANAGILRDASFVKMTNEQWDAVYRVHLRGTYSCAKAVWPHMRERGYGRILFVSSSSGLYGNFGQANYGAMKLGILGLCHVLAAEGAQKGILVNTIAPVAATKMTEGLLPPDLLAALKPDAVAPIVAFLAHESCDVSGGVYECGGGWVAKLRWQMSKGLFLPASQLTPENVAQRWRSDVESFEEAHVSYPTSNQHAFATLMQHWNNQTNTGAASASESSSSGSSAGATRGSPSSSSSPSAAALAVAVPPASQFLAPLAGGKVGRSDLIDVAQVTSYVFPTDCHKYTEHDVCLYALTVGCGAADPLDPRDLPFVYELTSAKGGLQVMPTFAALLPHAAMMSIVSVPGLSADPTMLLHGEQEIHFPSGALPASADVVSNTRIANVYDKGSGALAVLETVSVDAATARVLCVNRTSLFLRGVGNFGGDRSSGDAAAAWALPARGPDVRDELKTAKNQALYYRLNGDSNPLHVDPVFASAGGFKEPILHGLCFFGICGRSLLRHFGGADPARLKSIKARFVKHVFPGETVVFEAWDGGIVASSGLQRVLFHARVKERVAADGSGEVVLTAGVAEFVPAATQHAALLNAKL